MSELAIRSRQRVRRVNVRLLRQIIASLLKELIGAAEFQLCIHLIGAKEMAQINWRFLQHEGSTDVITFSHADGTRDLRGEIFVCLDDAVKQAREFRTSWQSELVRYIVHGVLHLSGYDDLKSAARGKMKREENRLHRLLTARFPLSKLARAPKLGA
jgi:probable rRNA maturation factor